VAVDVDRARHDDLGHASPLGQRAHRARLLGARTPRHRVDDRVGPRPLGRPAGREERGAVAVQVLEPGEARRLVGAGVGEHDFVAGGEQVRNGGLADRTRATDEQDAHGADLSATRRLQLSPARGWRGAERTDDAPPRR
jgi:hypothetical protein